MISTRLRALARVFGFVALLATSLTRPAAAAACNAVLGSWPLGPSYRVAFDGNVVLLGRGRELSIFGTANPNSTPPLLGRVTLPGQVRGIATSAVTPGLAAVALDGEGVALVSYSNPAAPVMTAHFAVGGRALADRLHDDILADVEIKRLDPFHQFGNIGANIFRLSQGSGSLLLVEGSHCLDGCGNLAGLGLNPFRLNRGNLVFPASRCLESSDARFRNPSINGVGDSACCHGN